MTKEEEQRRLTAAFNVAKELANRESQSNSWRSQVLEALSIAQIGKVDASFRPYVEEMLNTQGASLADLVSGVFASGLLVGYHMGQMDIEQDICIQLMSDN